MPDPVKKTVVKRKNRTTSVKNADGTTTKTRVRRDGSTKKVKTYKGNKTVASKVVKYRKDGSKKREVTRPGDKTGTVVSRTNKKGETRTYNKKKRLKDNIRASVSNLGVVGKAGLLTGAAVATGLAIPAISGAITIGAGLVAKDVVKGIKKVKPVKAIRKAGNLVMKGVKNKIQTGNRKGRSKR